MIISLKSSVTTETHHTSVYHTSFGQNNVDHSHETSKFHHGLAFIMPRYTCIIHSRPLWNVYWLATHKLS